MHRFKRVMVVVNGEKPLSEDLGFIRGLALAKKNQGVLTLFDVIRAPNHGYKKYKGIVDQAELIKVMREKRRQAIQEAVETFGDSGVPVDVDVAVGTDYIEIIKKMLQGDQDLLIKVASYHKGSYSACDFQLMRKCHKPVWLINPVYSGSYKRVLATIDLNLEDTAEGKALNSLIMDLATSLANWDDSELHVLSCWSVYGEASMRSSAFLRVSEAQLAQILEQEEAEQRLKFGELRSRYPDSEFHGHLMKGDPKTLLPEFVEEEQVDVVVMGTVGRSGVPGLVIGNTAETVLNSINSTVITVKPDQFASPVR